MIVLDTDHLSVLRYPESAPCIRLKGRMDAAADEAFVTTAINVAEQTRGVLALISRTHEVEKQPPFYDWLVELFVFFSRWRILPFDEPAVAQFQALRKQRIRIGTMDLKTASIALVHGVRLLSANLREFGKVPGLHVENWLS